MNRRHLEFRWQGRLGARFGWERRILRDRAGVFLVIYRLHYYAPSGYVCGSISLSPRWSRQQFAMHVRGLRERLRWRVAQESSTAAA